MTMRVTLSSINKTPELVLLPRGGGTGRRVGLGPPTFKFQILPKSV